MSQAAHDLHGEFWKPPVSEAAATPARPETTPTRACPRCGTEFVMGARYCHVCGSSRTAQRHSLQGTLVQVVNVLHHLRQSLKLPAWSLAAYILGIFCFAAAVATGFLFSADTLSDWQAIQAWRLEWLLGAVAAFVAGILLK